MRFILTALDETVKSPSKKVVSILHLTPPRRQQAILQFAEDSAGKALDSNGAAANFEGRSSSGSALPGLPDRKACAPRHKPQPLRPGQNRVDRGLPPSFANRVGQMEFPQLFFLPKRPGRFEVDSLLRLNELQRRSASGSPSAVRVEIGAGGELARIGKSAEKPWGIESFY